MITTYAQNFEDVLLWRALKDVVHGRYLDIGAQEPVIDSVSYLFSKRGWTGISVEPHPFYAGRFRELRPKDTVLQAAVSDVPGVVTLFASTGNGLSTCDPEVAEEHRRAGFDFLPVAVPTVRLDDLLADDARPIHWMKVDVEGFEANVLRSWGVATARPWIVIMESTAPNSQVELFDEWEGQLLERDYDFVHFDGLNRWYLHRSQAQRAAAFDAPPNIFDRFTITADHFSAGRLNERHQRELSRAHALAGREVAARDEEIQRRSDEVSGLSKAIEALHREVAARDRLIHERESELLRQREAQLDLQAHRAEEYAAVRADQDRQIRERDAEIARLRHVQFDLQAQRAQEVAALRAQLDALLTTSSSENSALSAERDELVASRDGLHAELSRKRRQFRAFIETVNGIASVLAATPATPKGGPSRWQPMLQPSRTRADFASLQSALRQSTDASNGAAEQLRRLTSIQENETSAVVSSRNQSAFFTIVSNNYLHFARTLLQSIRKFHPDASLFCVIVDSDHSYADELKDEFEVIRLADIDLPDDNRFRFRYNVLELNTAVKPWAFEYLMKQFARVIYIDPDIKLYAPLSELGELFDDGQDIILTPHLLAPITDDKHPSELDIRRSGTYNFGFCALRTSPDSAAFVKWWQSKLEFGCVVDLDKGIFVDQSWIDLVPGMFDHVAILRHPGYNIAYWNLAQRKVERTDRGYSVNGQPLKFFHYSGLNPLDPQNFSKHQNRFTLRNLGPVRDLVEDYVDALLQNGAAKYSALAYGFGKFVDGVAIPMWFAKLYRDTPDLQQRLGETPFEQQGVLNETARVVEGEPVTWAMEGMWQARADLRMAFPLTTATSVRDFLSWIAHEGENFLSKPVAKFHHDRFQVELAAGQSAAAESAAQPAVAQTLATAGNYRVADEVVAADLFYRILGRFPETGAVTTYARMLKKPFGRVRVWKAIGFSDESRHRPHFAGRLARALISADGRTTRSLPAISAIASDTAIPSAETRVDAIHDDVWHARRIRDADLSRPDDWLYAAEGNSPDEGRWSGETVIFRLPADSAAQTVRFKANFAPDLLALKDTESVNRLAFYLNDALLFECGETSSGQFAVDFRLPDTLPSRPHLVILIKDHVVPLEVGLNSDDRRLAIRLQELTVGDVALFDCANPDAQPADQRSFFPTPGMNLVGYVRAESGVGQAVRGLADAARVGNIPFSLIDVGFQAPHRQTDDSAEADALEEKQAIDVVFVNADQLFSTVRHLGGIDHSSTYRLGFWHWEQTVFPKQWHGAFDLLDEVWVPTAFVHDAVSAAASIPVTRIPNAVSFKVPKRPGRRKFNLPDRGRLALMMYDFHSYSFRKNPEAAIAAFRQAAEGRDDVTLVIKTIHADAYPKEFAALQEGVKDLSVVFVSSFLSRQEVYELQACCDVLISLHRAEGFGLAPAEMMYMGKPVVATGWSGNMDFMTPMNSFPVDYTLKPLDRDHGVYAAGSSWAEPDIDHAAWCLGQVFDQTEAAARKAKRAALDMRKHHSPAAVAEIVAKRLDLIATRNGIM